MAVAGPVEADAGTVLVAEDERARGLVREAVVAGLRHAVALVAVAPDHAVRQSLHDADAGPRVPREVQVVDARRKLDDRVAVAGPVGVQVPREVAGLNRAAAHRDLPALVAEVAGVADDRGVAARRRGRDAEDLVVALLVVVRHVEARAVVQSTQLQAEFGLRRRLRPDQRIAELGPLDEPDLTAEREADRRRVELVAPLVHPGRAGRVVPRRQAVRRRVVAHLGVRHPHLAELQPAGPPVERVREDDADAGGGVEVAVRVRRQRRAPVVPPGQGEVRPPLVVHRHLAVHPEQTPRLLEVREHSLVLEVLDVVVVRDHYGAAPADDAAVLRRPDVAADHPADAEALGELHGVQGEHEIVVDLRAVELLLLGVAGSEPLGSPPRPLVLVGAALVQVRVEPEGVAEPEPGHEGGRELLRDDPAVDVAVPVLVLGDPLVVGTVGTPHHRRPVVVPRRADVDVGRNVEQVVVDADPGVVRPRVARVGPLDARRRGEPVRHLQADVRGRVEALELPSRGDVALVQVRDPEGERPGAAQAARGPQGVVQRLRGLVELAARVLEDDLAQRGDHLGRNAVPVGTPARIAGAGDGAGLEAGGGRVPRLAVATLRLEPAVAEEAVAPRGPVGHVARDDRVVHAVGRRVLEAHRLARRPLLRLDDDRAPGRARPVERRRGGAPQHRDLIDVGEVEVHAAVAGLPATVDASARLGVQIDADRYAVDDEQRLARPREGGLPADLDGRGSARATARLNDLDARGLALQRLHEVDLGRSLQRLRGHRLDRVGERALLPLQAQGGHHQPLDRDRLRGEREVGRHGATLRDRHLLLRRRVAQEPHAHRVGAGRHVQQHVASLGVAQVAAGRAVEADLGVEEGRLVRGVGDPPDHGAALLLGGHRGCYSEGEQPQAERGQHSPGHRTPP